LDLKLNIWEKTGGPARGSDPKIQPVLS